MSRVCVKGRVLCDVKGLCEGWMKGAARCALDEGCSAISITLHVERRCTICVALDAGWMKMCVERGGLET